MRVFTIESTKHKARIKNKERKCRAYATSTTIYRFLYRSIMDVESSKNKIKKIDLKFVLEFIRIELFYRNKQKVNILIYYIQNI